MNRHLRSSATQTVTVEFNLPNESGPSTFSRAVDLQPPGISSNILLLSHHIPILPERQEDRVDGNDDYQRLH